MSHAKVSNPRKGARLARRQKADVVARCDEDFHSFRVPGLLSSREARLSSNFNYFPILPASRLILLLWPWHAPHGGAPHLRQRK